jgi:hypothetical protein
MLFKKIAKKKDPVVVDKKRAQEIYGMLAGGLNETTLFTEHEVAFEESAIVMAEIRRLEAEVMSKMSGNYITVPEIPEIRDENNKVIQEFVPAVYFVVKDEKMLVESLKSELLDVAILVTDVRRFSDGNPDDAPDFKTWLEGFKKEM